MVATVVESVAVVAAFVTAVGFSCRAGVVELASTVFVPDIGSSSRSRRKNSCRGYIQTVWLTQLVFAAIGSGLADSASACSRRIGVPLRAAMPRGAPLSQSDARALINEVVDFIVEYGKRPPRSMPLGLRAYNLARQHAETTESIEMRKILDEAQQAWSSTVNHITNIHRDAELPAEQETTQRKRFRVNHDYRIRAMADSAIATRAGSASVVASASVAKRPASASVAKRPARSNTSASAVGSASSSSTTAAGSATSSSTPSTTHMVGRADVGRPRRRPCCDSGAGVDLSDMPQRARIGVVQILPQLAVDFLYKALHDFSCFMKESGGQWVITWGTLLGAHRGQGMVPYDVDVDVALLVQSELHFTEVWFPRIASHFEPLGYRVHPVPCAPAASAGCRALLRGCKLAPRRAGCTQKQLFRELLSRRRESAIAKGECLNRAQCIADVANKCRRATFEQKRRWAADAIGVHVIDIEVCTIVGGRCQIAGGAAQWPGDTLDTTQLQFGPITVPGPLDVAGALTAFYPNGYVGRMYKNANGKLFPVPTGVPERAMPSDGVIDVPSVVSAE